MGEPELQRGELDTMVVTLKEAMSQGKLTDAEVTELRHAYTTTESEIKG